MDGQPEKIKPLGIKNYGHVPHLPGSRMGPADKHCHVGQERICTQQPRDRHDRITVQEKLDGSNVGVARKNDKLYPLGRAGYLASSSRFEQHWRFSEWVFANQDRFMDTLREHNPPERIVGEWLMQAHSTRYKLKHEPFVAFDLMVGIERLPFDEFEERVAKTSWLLKHQDDPDDPKFITPATLWHGCLPVPVPLAMSRVSVLGDDGTYGFHGALDAVEGVVYRVERNELVKGAFDGRRQYRVDFLAKYVRPEKKDGIYLPEVSGQPPVWNWYPVETKKVQLT